MERRRKPLAATALLHNASGEHGCDWKKIAKTGPAHSELPVCRHPARSSWRLPWFLICCRGAPLLETVAAIDRAALSKFERNRGFLAALGAHRGGHNSS